MSRTENTETLFIIFSSVSSHIRSSVFFRLTGCISHIRCSNVFVTLFFSSLLLLLVMEATISRRGAQLPEDVMIQILLRLPVKSLLRFKSASKTWYVLIKSPYFISMHHKFNLGLGSLSRLLMCSTPESQEENDLNNHVFTIHSNGKSASVNINMPELEILANPDTYVYLVAGSCHGIVCYYDELGSIFLSNPATREFKQLPPTPFQQGTTDPKFYQHGVAFGFASTNMYDFKVLRLFSAVSKKGCPKPTHKGFRAEIFTLSSNTWKQLDWGLDDRLVFCSDQGLFCANSFHFIANRHKCPGEAIVCCDVHTERFRTIELPSSGKGFFTSLKLFKEFLSAVCTFPESIEIWIMEDYGVVQSWTKLYSIGPPWGCCFPLCFWTENDALLLRLRQEKTYKLFTGHPNPLNFEGIEIKGYNCYSQFVLHQETLVSIM